MKFFIAEGLPKKIISAIFILKIISGIILWVIYTYHYTYRETSDAFRFFDDAVIILNSTKGHFLHFLQILFGINADAEELKKYLAQTNHWYKPYDYGLHNDDRTLIRFNAIVLFFSFGMYHVHGVFMNFFSLIGLFALYKTFVKILPERKMELFAAIFFIPTVLFWGSGVMKEGLILFALGIFIYSFFQIIEQKTDTKNSVVLLFALFLLCIVKIYVLLCLLPAIISIVIIKFSGQKMLTLKFIAIHILLIIFILNIHHIFPGYNVLEILQTKQHDFYNVAQLWNAGSAIDIGRLEPDFLSFTKHIPQALFTVFFRPHLFESESVFLFLSALENLLFFALIIFYSFHFKKPGKENLQWFLLCLSFIIFLALLIGWTTPIMGAIVRYKLPLLPFFIFIFLFFSEKPKLISRTETWLKSH